MRFLLTAVKKDLGRLRCDPLALATSLGISLVLVNLADEKVHKTVKFMLQPIAPG